MKEESTPWHALELAGVHQQIDATEAGLSAAEAVARLGRFGPNRLPSRPPPGFVRILVRQFESPLIYILGAASVVSLLIGEYSDAGFIAAVLVLNAAIGTFHEWKAERGMRALQRFLQTRALVVRDGEEQDIDAELLVPGDLVLLESGNRVPADLRLLAATGFEVDESLLTGESIPVAKNPSWKGRAATALGDRVNMAHAGSIVARGRARGIVVLTGIGTAIGGVAQRTLEATAGKPPLQVRMERFTRLVAVVVLIASVAIGLVAVLGRGYGIVETFMFAVALAVSAIPEGLPVAMTVALAVATHRMSNRGVIVRRLAAVEGLGSCTLIASDKTGTLTVNELTVRCATLPDGTRLDVTGEGYVPEGLILQGGREVVPGSVESLALLARAGTLCNEADLHHRNGAWAWRGDPTDIAHLCFGLKAGWKPTVAAEMFPQVNQIPFEPERRFAATFHRVEGGTLCLVKGAPERVLSMCAWAGTGDAATARDRAEAMAAEGFRVLAFAEARSPTALLPSDLPPEPSGLRFLGFTGMIDPLRRGVMDAVTRCRNAGIGVCMVTGDHPVTALAISRALTLAESPDQVVTGAVLEAMGEEEVAALTQTVRVFARVSPHQKLQIVQAAQRWGHFVAVTGDGVNDAPALRQANIGVAMGRGGTDVAREASDLVITDDNFVSIVAGVEEGRIAYDNIRKVIYLLVSTGAAEILLAGLAIALGTPLPLLPVQLLWLNLVTNGIQDVALAFERGERDVMSRRPRQPTERIFNQLMIERTAVAAVVMGGVGFGLFTRLLQQGWEEAEARNVLLLLMVLFENIHIGNCRSETRSAFRLSPFRSPILLGGTLLAFGVHLAMMHLPLGRVIGASPVSPGTWAVALPLAVSIFVVMELHKLSWWLRHRAKDR